MSELSQYETIRVSTSEGDNSNILQMTLLSSGWEYGGPWYRRLKREDFGVPKVTLKAEYKDRAGIWQPLVSPTKIDTDTDKRAEYLATAAFVKRWLRELRSELTPFHPLKYSLRQYIDAIISEIDTHTARMQR